jgi:hypothetical protein
MKITQWVMALLGLVILAGCATDNLKSPCVGAAGSPCERRPIGQDRELT